MAKSRNDCSQTASEADSGPWVRGNVTGSQRQQDVPIRNIERPAVPSRFSNREQARGEADSTTNWRKGQVAQRDRDQSVGKVSDNHNLTFIQILIFAQMLVCKTI